MRQVAVRAALMVVMVGVAACGPMVDVLDGGAGGGAGGGSAGGAGGGSTQMHSTDAGIPCAVAQMVGNKCLSCHGTTPANSATFSLVTYDDFMKPSLTVPNETMAQRSLARMTTTAANTMPPQSSPQPTPDQITEFAAWVTSGSAPGACKTTGPFPATCASNSYWTGGDRESENMNPGLACKECHARRAKFKNYSFMGTIFPNSNEKDLCNSLPPSGMVIEILDKTGKVALTMSPRTPSGNFHSLSLTNTVALPYTARVTYNGQTSMMTTPQTDGDCNGCHTEQGKNGATGRIVWPTASH